MSTSISDICKALAESAQAETPYISGSFILGASESGLFYRGSNGLGLLDLSTATNEELESLSNACQPASFGVGGQDVLDPSYRKAGKMDPVCFATHFSPVNHGIVDLIKLDLFQGGDNRGIAIELYKLNVYGPGSFFKAHIDTPRSENMFGSLVVVLPTAHEGGSLILRHAGKEWTFDSAATVGINDSVNPPTNGSRLRAAFTAFYSDVEHEITPVVSGYRVTLTYNLYFTNTTPVDVLGTAGIRPQSSATTTIHNHLSALLSVPSFLERGGRLGFKLVHKYPVHRSTDLRMIANMLKGPDARILLACSSLGLKTSLRVFYTFESKEWSCDTRKRYMASKAIDADDYGEIRSSHWEETAYFLKHECQAQAILFTSLSSTSERHLKGGTNSRRVYWVNPDVQNGTKVESAYMAYGNEASLKYFYGDVAIVAEVGGAGERRTVGPME